MSLTRIVGRSHVLGENINTDVHCSAKYMPGRDAAYVAQHAFEQVAPSFIAEFRFGDVIVAGKNFGINSSREQAIQVMRLLGVSAVVAPSFGRQFYRNAINNGLPLVECDTSGIEDKDEIDIDFRACTLVVSERNIMRAMPRLPSEIRTLLATGGLIAFLQRHPDWGVDIAEKDAV